MNILALDTCTEMCSAAIVFNGQLFACSELTHRGHSEKILGMLDSVMADAGCTLLDIDVVAFGRGPGSFTGVRVGVGVAQGIAFARNLPVVPVSTMAAVAQIAIDDYSAKRVAVAMDARMGEVYTGHFIENNGLANALDEEQVCPPDRYQPADKDKWFAAGTGWTEYETVLSQNFAGQVTEKQALLPTAAAIAKLAMVMAENGQTIPAEQAVPVYLRDNVAKKKGEQ
ncbi:tRNA (adenosine(37)-N6)-threonylcarbamoyltransferase complex dimerization subunit type 1 TsaB [Methylophaga sp.]|uniref:tRNA (adenosine(37)-N6)-threonylcarbamoyltransferase complex dimerization subunit type 1 TsaB n=1 Tax=Methylophaga sp. TaxID=2024840 RepID=UPI003F69D128